MSLCHVCEYSFDQYLCGIEITSDLLNNKYKLPK